MLPGMDGLGIAAVKYPTTFLPLKSSERAMPPPPPIVLPIPITANGIIRHDPCNKPNRMAMINDACRQDHGEGFIVERIAICTLEPLATVRREQYSTPR